MKPFFREGDILVIENVPLDEIKSGNVIAYRIPSRGKRVVHRVVATRTQGKTKAFITHGDNVRYPDELVQPDWIEGRVSGKYENKQVVRISRFDELFGLLCPGWYRKFTTLAGRILSPLLPWLYHFLPVRTQRFRNAEGEHQVAVVLGKVVARKVKTSRGEGLWIHPLFIKTRLIDQLRNQGA